MNIKRVLYNLSLVQALSMWFCFFCFGFGFLFVCLWVFVCFFGGVVLFCFCFIHLVFGFLFFWGLWSLVVVIAVFILPRKRL